MARKSWPATASIEASVLAARLEISQRTLESRRGSTKLIRQRFEGGVVSQLDVHQAEIEEAIAAAAVPLFERQIAHLTTGGS